MHSVGKAIGEDADGAGLHYLYLVSWDMGNVWVLDDEITIKRHTHFF